MKFLKKISLVYSLQIMAVFLLFFFPGFSTLPEKEEINNSKPVRVQTGYGMPDETLNPLQKAGDPFFILQYPEAAARQIISITGSR